MDTTERAMLIRRGNELFNGKDYKNALKIFIAVEYKDGIARMAGVMEHEKKDKVTALKLYIKSGMRGNVEKLSYEMAQTVRFLVKEDKELTANQKGENFDRGYKVSGQAPEMMPYEVLKIAKEKLSQKNPTFADKKEAQSWKPISISRKELDK
jgi:hypothetical protein